MAGAVRFNLEVFIKNPDLFPELMGRVRDLRPAFEVMIRKWADNNSDKFGKAVGAEESGISVDPTVFWERLSPRYIIRKRKQGFPNQIMVRTGALEAALTDPEGFFSAMTTEEAVFGTPKSYDEEMKARYNMNKRQTIFLSLDDQRMIQATMKHYLELGEDFEKIMFSRGLQNVRTGNEVAQMDMAFDTAAAES